MNGRPKRIKESLEPTPDEKAAGKTLAQRVSRETGQFMHYVQDRRSTIDVKANCEPAPFSGFPDFETKF